MKTDLKGRGSTEMRTEEASHLLKVLKKNRRPDLESGHWIYKVRARVLAARTFVENAYIY